MNFTLQRRSNTLIWEGFCTRDLVTRLLPARPNSHDEYDVDTAAEFGIQRFRTEWRGTCSRDRKLSIAKVFENRCKRIQETRFPRRIKDPRDKRVKTKARVLIV